MTLDIDGARAAARAADAVAARGEWMGPLHGLPVTIKNAIEVAGVRSTSGAGELAHHLPRADAPAVARVKAAGALVVGKTNAPRWSGDMQTYNELFGTTSNPWALDRVPGGSSGGSAVQRAAASRPSSWAATSAARCASPHTAVGSSGSSRATGGAPAWLP